MILEHDLADDVGVEQLVLQPGQDPALEHVGLDGAAVRAVAPLAAVAAAPFLGADDDIAATAAAALDQPREQPLWPPLLLRPGPVEARPAHRHGRPQRLVDDPQLRRRPNCPLLARADPDALHARLRVVGTPRPVEDEHSPVEVVLQDAVAAHAVAVDRRRRPSAPGRAGDSFRVEARGDLARAAAVDELGEDPADDRRLLLVDLAKAVNWLTALVEAGDAAIAVGAPAGHEAGEDATGLAAPGLVGQVLAKQRRHGALEADVQLADVALAQGHQPRAGKGDPLEDRGDVLLVAAQPVDRFRQDDVGAAADDRLEQRVKPRPVADGAADRIVGVDAGDLPALGRGALAADAHLVLDRRLALERRRIASVDEGAGHWTSFADRARNWSASMIVGHARLLLWSEQRPVTR
ncbi:MAG TPA: hypothetical protein VNH53_03990 [Sphingomicrobium sp.]|nr:hypothetical protein [Sphingomicrobium sp.]